MMGWLALTSSRLTPNNSLQKKIIISTRDTRQTVVRVITRCCEDLERDFPSKKDEVNKCKSYKRKKGRKRKALIL